MAHLLHVDLLEQRAHIDTLDQLQDHLLELLVSVLVLDILLLSKLVALSENLVLLLQTLLLGLELRQSQLLLDDLLLVGDATCLHLLGILECGLGGVLGINLLVEHDLTLLLLLGQLFEHDLGMIALSLQLVL